MPLALPKCLNPKSEFQSRLQIPFEKASITDYKNSVQKQPITNFY
jgi:hypothetical protein